MKTKHIAIATLAALLSMSCVQKTQKRVVVLTLDVSKVKKIKKVGIQGWDNPLSWNADYPLQEIKKDSLYRATLVSNTGRICIEFKFSVNGQLELDGKENRKLYFDTKKDTTRTSLVFDQE